MKTIQKVSILSLAVIALLFAACSESINGVDETITLAEAEAEKSAETFSDPSDSCTFTGTLSEAEIDGLMEMREEEKLAHDVYVKLFEVHEHPVFNNISKSETAHTSAVLYLINGYDLEDPALSVEGEFSNPLFNDLYEQLTEQGSASLIDGLKVGAFIEEYDINDLQHLLAEVENEDVKRVYENLLRGSTFHLRAFTAVLKAQGVVYEPEILSAEQYQEILNSEEEMEEETETVTFTPPEGCTGTGPNA